MKIKSSGTIYLNPKKKTKLKKQSKKRISKKELFWYLLVFNTIKNNIKQTQLLLTSGLSFFSLFIIFSLFTILYFFIQTHEEFSAGFADDYLRPVIGSQAVVSMEAVFFNLQDKFNQLQYLFNKPSDKALANISVPSIAPAPTVPVKDTSFHLDPVKPIIKDNPMPKEGIWIPVTIASEEGKLASQEANIATKEAVMAQTTLRPDPRREYANVTIIKLNMEELSASGVAGLKEPGGTDKPGPGMIPEEIQKSNRLLAAFNGGFLGKDGNFGMRVGTTEYLPLQKDLATFVISESAKPKIIKFTGQNLDHAQAVRQNGPLLIEDSKIVASSSAWNMQTWGLTTTNSMYTWRSGIGITQDGDLIYACGPSLIPETLATALQAAGAVNGMQLDINSAWVRFALFTPIGKGQYNSKPLRPEMISGETEFLHGYRKDFFFIYRK